MIPNIEFRYSYVYDEVWSDIVKDKKYPSSKKVLTCLKKGEKLWKREERRVLSELSKVTGLSWEAGSIPCYVVGKCIPFSDPLTVPIFPQTDYFLDVLIHELIHQLFMQEGNLERADKSWKYISKEDAHYSPNTRVHIMLHAVHSHIYLKFYSKKRLERDKRLVYKVSDYKIAWKIVEEKGYEKILADFKKRVQQTL